MAQGCGNQAKAIPILDNGRMGRLKAVGCTLLRLDRDTKESSNSF